MNRTTIDLTKHWQRLAGAARQGAQCAEIIERGQADMPLTRQLEALSQGPTPAPLAAVLLGLSAGAKDAAVSWLCFQAGEPPPPTTQEGASTLPLPALGLDLQVVWSCLAAGQSRQQLVATVASTHLMLLAVDHTAAPSIEDRRFLADLSTLGRVVLPLVHVEGETEESIPSWLDELKEGGCVLLPPVVLKRSKSQNAPEVLSNPSCDLRQALVMLHATRRLSLASRLILASWTREQRRIASRQRRLVRAARSLEDQGKRADLRADLDPVRASLERGLAALAEEIKERSRKTALPSSETQARLNEAVLCLSADDLMSDEIHGVLKLRFTVDDGALSALQEAAQETLRESLQNDVAFVARELRRLNTALAAELILLAGEEDLPRTGRLAAPPPSRASRSLRASPQGRPAFGWCPAFPGVRAPSSVALTPSSALDKRGLVLPSPDEHKLAVVLEEAVSFEIGYKSEQDKRTFWRRLAEGRRFVLVILMTLSLFGGALGFNRKAGPVVALTFLLFAYGVAHTFVAWKREERHWLEREIEKVQDSLSLQTKQLVAQTEREKVSRLLQHLGDTKRSYLQALEEAGRSAALERAARMEQEKEDLRWASRAAEVAARQAQSDNPLFAKLLEEERKLEAGCRELVAGLETGLITVRKETP